MPPVFSATSAAVSVTARDLIVSALKKLGVLAVGETPDDAEGLSDGLEDLQALIDQWNAQRGLIYNLNFQSYNLQPNHAPHTIGPAGDFNAAVRPVRIIACTVILNSGTANPIDTPVRVTSDDWWAQLPNKSQISAFPTHLYYSPDVPLGNLNFWPIPNIANAVRLETWSSLSQAVDLDTVLALPQGYWQALRSTLPVIMAPSYGVQPSAALMQQQRQAMQAIVDNNDDPPVIETDSGMPNSRKGSRPDFNFITGLRE